MPVLVVTNVAALCHWLCHFYVTVKCTCARFDACASPVMASQRSIKELPGSHDVFGAPQAPFPSYSWCYYESSPSYPSPAVLGSQQLVASNASGLDTELYGAGIPDGGRAHGDGQFVGGREQAGGWHMPASEGGRERGDGTMSAFGRNLGQLERGIRHLDSPGE